MKAKMTAGSNDIENGRGGENEIMAKMVANVK